MPPRRRVNPKSFFEPMYTPDPLVPFEGDSFKNSDWDFSNNKGPCRLTFSAELFNEKYEESSFEKFENIKFIECDFRGKFEGKILHFHNCKFELCDFGGSEFHNDKFTSCEFDKTSFTLTKFYNCQIRNCKFSDIGVSGNETQFFSTDLTNPGDFIDAASTNLKYLPDGRRPEYQKLRLEMTKGTISKVILHNLAKEGADYSYYDAVRAAQLHGALADRAYGVLLGPEFDEEERREGRGKFGKFIQKVKSFGSSKTAAVEYWLLLLVGSMNGWGRSISRTVFIGFIFVVCFSLVRFGVTPSGIIPAAFQTLEIFLVFGYSKYSVITDGALKSLLDLGTAICGLGWYAVAAATVVSKITKVRG